MTDTIDPERKARLRRMAGAMGKRIDRRNVAALKTIRRWDPRVELERITAEADEALARSAELVVLAGRRDGKDRARRTITAGLKEAPAFRAVSIQPRSANPKLAPQNSVEARSGRNRYEPAGPYCASTYTSIAATCPEVCPFRDNGCFAQAGASHLTMGDLDRAGRRTTALEVSLAEAGKLDALWVRGVPSEGHRGRGVDLRLHVGGDVSCERGARALADAVRRLQARGLGACWTYTHRWREIPRHAWGPIAVLASCETPGDALEASRRGYATAITVGAFPSRKRFYLGPGAGRAIPCPFEAGAGVTCVQCRLCFDDRRLHRHRLSIAFAVHGKDADKARRRLEVLNG